MIFIKSKKPKLILSTIFLVLILAGSILYQQKIKADVIESQNIIVGSVTDKNSIPLSGIVSIVSKNYNKEIEVKNGQFLINDITKELKVDITFRSYDGWAYWNDSEHAKILKPGLQLKLSNMKAVNQYLSDQEVADTIVPTIEKQFGDTLPSNQDIDLKFKITDNTSLDVAELWFKPDTQTDWEVATFSIDGEIYTATVKASKLTNARELQYYVRAKDTRSNIAWFPVVATNGNAGSQNPGKVGLTTGNTITLCSTGVIIQGKTLLRRAGAIAFTPVIAEISGANGNTITPTVQSNPSTGAFILRVPKEIANKDIRITIKVNGVIKVIYTKNPNCAALNLGTINLQ